MYAGREDARALLFARLTEAGRWAALAHVLDYDDLHMPSTTHISAVCVPAALSAPSGDAARAYLAGAGGVRLEENLELPPGAPERPPTDDELRAKLELCTGAEAERVAGLSWETAAAYLRSTLASLGESN